MRTHSNASDNLRGTHLVEPHPETIGFPIDHWPAIGSEESIQLDTCAPFEKFVVNTVKSVYEMIVLSGSDGEVLVRGGRFFPEFRRAILAGSTAGGSALKLRTVAEGLHMELHAEGRVYPYLPGRVDLTSVMSRDAREEYTLPTSIC